ncbi:IS1634 family transposase [Nostoc sp. 'Peltigera membranacea cyanobiont' N6]|uniref:IS1634 family transposase n=1 Tax=Nostoc sp. 'Peltigera membranacea cyanobiont' N6 TaxID=1261031 RepID=UPI000CF31389|nr:IS1634 family transposase [Nostoc sp. 'Peltigera membranacea cyanobiont' N6]AVH63641.1 transposase [Nostoc sp. 'Peltigera membranacea cyanobiont' N6]AVH66322.1 transposase [Nostoc sp. 'Peltigera membranacea cyanobiont' N6]
MAINEQVKIYSERIDDIPVIVEWLNKMEIGKWIDQKLTPPHGNHKGLSYGELSVLLLIYIITQSDHRLSAVEPWIEANRKILELTTGWSIGKKDATDDRLARVVEELGLQSEARLEIEVKLGRHLIRAYELPTEVARTDTTSFSVNHQQDESAQESLLRYGYSKDKRPDLLQYRQLLATLDPMGMPLVSATLEGNGADDPLYLPTWQKLVKVIGHKKFVFIADCKAGSMATRAQIAANAGIYCFPVPMSGQHPQYLKQWVLSPPAETLSIRLPRQDEEEPAVGKGFEVELGKFWFNQETNKWVRWHERYLVVYSQSLAASAIRGQQQRLLTARTALDKLANKPGDDREELSHKVENIKKRYRVKDFFSTMITEEIIKETRNCRRGRPSKNSTTAEVTKICLQLHIHPIHTAIKEAETLAGWRLYVTNAPTTRLTLPQAVMYYRDEWLLERGFHRFKRGSLPALPIYFQNEDRITGLMFILNIALRVFTLMEFVVRKALQQTQQSLAGLYDGNPKRKTSRPSAERMLKAFCHLTLYYLPDSTIFITPLSELQKQILALMKMPESLYQLDSLHCKT